MSSERKPPSTPTPTHDLAITYAKDRIKRLVMRANTQAAAGLANAELQSREIISLCQQDLAGLQASRLAASRG
jgi:hypothetical protein